MCIVKNVNDGRLSHWLGSDMVQKYTNTKQPLLKNEILHSQSAHVFEQEMNWNFPPHSVVNLMDTCETELVVTVCSPMLCCMAAYQG